MSLDDSAARWFLDRRGIRRETLEAFGVSSESDDVTLFPYPGGATKYRKGWEKEGRKFWWDPPTQAGQVPFLPPGFDPSSAMILLEGETDTMSCWQNAPGEARRSIVGLSGLNAWKDRYGDELFNAAKVVWVVFDNDDPYGPAKLQNDKSWRQIREALGPKAKRVTLPQGIEDVAEFFQTYDWAAFRVLLDQALVHHYNYAALDLGGEAPEYDWLVPDLIVKGDVVMLAGDPGVGKSWYTLDLCTALAEGRDSWLGIPLPGFPTKSMIVDQENPQTTIRQRLERLGLSEAGKKNLRYLWYAGVRLDSEPEKLYEDVEAFMPEVLVIDSISRVHMKNENSAEEMNPLLNGGIYPIARKLGVTVILIHHLNKGGGTRGSTSLPAATDLTLLVRNEELKDGSLTGRQVITPDKLRNVPPWGAALVSERVEEDGRMTITGIREEDPF